MCVPGALPHEASTQRSTGPEDALATGRWSCVPVNWNATVVSAGCASETSSGVIEYQVFSLFCGTSQASGSLGCLGWLQNPDMMSLHCVPLLCFCVLRPLLASNSLCSQG